MIGNIAVIGSTGAIGSAIAKEAQLRYPQCKLFTFSRADTDAPLHRQISYDCEASIASALNSLNEKDRFDLVIVATGLLHSSSLQPEKSIKDLNAAALHQSFAANVIAPALLAKYFIPRLNTQNTSVFAALSARVGSISDNRIGGWYGYRSSKAALNMLIKNLAIETARKNPKAIIAGLHPGTVDSTLSKPFQSGLKHTLFTPAFSAAKLLNVVEQFQTADTGKCFAWDGKEIAP